METINEIRKIFQDNLRRINEIKIDRSNLINVGYVISNYPTSTKYNIYVDDEYPKPDLHEPNTFEYKKFKEFHTTFEREGRFNWGIYPDSITEIHIKPQYKGTYWDYFYNGLNETKEQQHEYLMSQLNTIGDKVILKHNSPYKIENGVVGGANKKGPNFYSNNSDVGNYFWASEYEGSDQSSSGEYKYYCEVPLNDIYDFQYNDKGYKTVKQAAENEKVVVLPWKNGGGIVAVSFSAIPIVKVEHSRVQ